MELLLATSPLLAITIVRFTLGVIFLAHGAPKVLGWFGGYGLKSTVGYLSSIGLPVPIAYAVCFFEFFGGIGLTLGQCTFAMAPTMTMMTASAEARVSRP